ncbi:MAG: hypothetical protein WC938_01030 [Candidatus Paceibacterota bacterium]|jgi:hypothetical protein
MDNILFFIEEIIIKYDLEKDLIENDSELKDALSKAEDIPERVFFKFIFSNKIANYEKQELPLDIPSMKLKKIIEDLINKKESLSNLPTLIQENLKISPEISNKIAEEIRANKELMDEINSTKIPEENNDIEDNIESQKEEPKKTKSIGYELLK